jgi:hypothetical protein
MPRLPRRLGNKTPFGAEWDALIDYLRSLRPVGEAGTEHSVFGVRRGTTTTATAKTQPLDQTLTLVSHAGDYLVCEDANEVTVLVAKSPALRYSVDSETIDGVTISYTYPDTGATQRRTASWSGGSEDQVIVPRYIMGRKIFARRVLDSGVTVSDNELEWLEHQDSHAWAKEYEPPS